MQPDGSVKSSFVKFLSPEKMAELVAAMDGQPGDALFFVADKNATVYQALGALRLEIAHRHNLIPEGKYNLFWVTEFPMYEWSDEEGRYMAMHHPFTSCMEEDLPLLDTDMGKVRANAYGPGAQTASRWVRALSAYTPAKCSRRPSTSWA